MIDAVSLDAHGTLIELPSPAEPLRELLASRFGVDVTVAEVGAAFKAEVRYYRAHMIEGRDAASLLALRGACAEVLRAALPKSPALSAAPTGALADALLESLHFRAFTDVLPALRTLRAAGIRLAVASNWDASLAGTLGRLGVAAELDGVVTSADVGAGKPDPAVIRGALACMDTSPSRAIHVGDVYDEDVLGARAAGVEPVLLARGGAPDTDVRVIRSLAELPALLGAGAAAGS